MTRIFTVMVLCAGVLSAQGILEYGVLSGAGAVGAAGVGKSVGGVLQKTADVTVEASGIDGVKTSPAARAAALAAQRKPAVVVEPEVIRGSAKTAAAVPVRVPAPIPPVAFPVSGEAGATPKVATREGLMGVRPGESRESVISQVGVPMSRINLPGDDGLVEVYQYRAVGGVRFKDGVVVSVQIAE
jgi:hypothetical protein